MHRVSVEDDVRALVFDVRVTDDLYQVVRSAAAAIETRESARQQAGRQAGAEFRGLFAELFERALAEAGREASRLCAALRALGHAADDLAAAAFAEDRRRSEVREWQARQRLREKVYAGMGQPATAVVGFLTDPRPGPGAPAPSHTAAVTIGRADLPRPGTAHGRTGKGLVSASPGGAARLRGGGAVAR
jgi:hypothetical protein